VRLGEATAEGAQRRAADRETDLGEAEVATTQQRHRALDTPRHQAAVRRLAVGEQLDLDPAEVRDARWLSPDEFLRLEPIFDPDREFFERVLPALTASVAVSEDDGAPR
jgi:sarcosine oxidase gamma subunit